MRIKKTVQIAHKNGLYVLDGLQHNIENKIYYCTRLGFASSNFQKLQVAMFILKKACFVFNKIVGENTPKETEKLVYNHFQHSTRYNKGLVFVSKFFCGSVIVNPTI
jgi:hypothetical protein